MLNENTSRVVSALADFLSKSKDEITERWLLSVRQTPDIPSANTLSDEKLIDHFPMVLTTLCDALRVLDIESVRTELNGCARAHGHLRWQHKYKLRELVREADLARRILLLEYVTAFGSQNPEFLDEVKNKSKQVIHRFFNELTIASAEQFSEDSEREIRRYSEELKTANQRLNDIDQSRLRLTRTLSHELKNILTSANLAVVLLRKGPEEAQRQKIMAMLLRNLSDMNGLVEQLLNYSVLIAGHEQINIDRFNPSEVCEELAISFGPVTESKGLELKVDCESSLCDVSCDRLKVKQIAANLLSNAIKYTPKGSINLRIGRHDEQMWVIEVKDTGVGIDSENIDRIFEEFHRAGVSSDIHGAGLGLAITKRLTELLDGRITVSSEVGVGSRFEVLLPIEAKD